MVREGRVFKSQTGSGKPEYGVGFYVTAYEVGAEVTNGSIGTTVTVRSGHGFATDDRFIVGTDAGRFRRVLSVTDTTLEIDSNVPLAGGELLVNLGQDTGDTEPQYDSNSVQIFADMDYSNLLNNSTVWSDAVGRYRYHHRNIAIWELVRTPSNVPFAIYTDAHPIQDELVTSVGIRYAHLFANAGDGTEGNPWSAATLGTNPVQAAIDDLPVTGGTVECIAGFYDIGSSTNAILIPALQSTTDKRAYTLRGHGRDLTFLRYSGTGRAIALIQINTGTPGDSWQTNQIALKGFAVQQVGTPRTGTGIYGNYVSESLFEDLVVGNVRMDRQIGEDDFGFQYGIQFSGAPSDEVSDFNRFHRIYAMGNIHAMYLQNQADNTVISECSFEARQSIGVEQDGVEISNSSGITIEKSHFNFFNNSSDSFAIKLTTDVSGVVIQGNYLEANWNSIVLYSDGNQDGIVIQGNLFALQAVAGLSGPTYVHGVKAGIDSSVWSIRGLVIQGNQFQRLQDYTRGVRIGGEVRSYLLLNNRYEIEGTTDCYNNTRVTAAGFGSEGITMEVTPESNSTTNETQSLQISHKAQDGTAIYLRNTNAGSQKSPRLRFGPDTTFLQDFILEASAIGKLNFVSAAGAVIATMGQTGVLTLDSIVTSGNNTLGDGANDQTTNVGRMIFRQISVDPTSVATVGSVGEIVYSTSTAKFYGKHTDGSSNTSWRLLGT